MSIAEKLDTLREVVRDYVTHNFMSEVTALEPDATAACQSCESK